MRIRCGILAAVALLLGVATVQAATPPPLQALQFLVGTWRAEGGGGPGQGSGTFSFARSLQDRVILRTNTADYPAAGDRPASRHDDLMVVYVSDGGSVRADYYDSEGHVIRYAATAASDQELTLVSDAAAGAPRFRLSYKLGKDGVLAGSFDIAPPGKPDAFAPYLHWTARKSS
jgi:hypothetical protein